MKFSITCIVLLTWSFSLSVLAQEPMAFDNKEQKDRFNQLTQELRCGHTYCTLCMFKRLELIREKICLVCLVDDKKYVTQDMSKFTLRNLPWAKMRFEDVKL